MGKHLPRVDICFNAQGFHLSPNVGAADGLACASHKNHTAFDSLLRCIAEQFLFQLFYDENRPCFRLAVHRRLAVFYCLNRDILQLADPNTCAADGLQNQVEPLIVLALGRSAKPCVFRPCQFFLLGAEYLLLQFQRFHLQIVPI